ncbi:hypothetical protein GCM10017667_55950 [Streptomyces filamentosus]|uniref:Uncharacterized protein n=1 Tax=Streptomyces filamentosus TaxID=67294 RepID=A0A919ER35_STRFL|nr:hypothetical protein GCM10017667_55950 [Streptomyces filamentosus]
MRIDEAVAEALDAIGDDAVYAEARGLLVKADRLLREGTSGEAARALDEALRVLDAACPF